MAQCVLKHNYPVSKSELFKSISSSKELKKWCAPGEMTVASVHLPNKEGASFDITMRSKEGEDFKAVGKVLEIIPNERISLSWKWEGLGGANESVLDMQVLDSPHSSELILMHGGLKDEADAGRHREGWERCLHKLKRLYQRG